MNFRIKICLFLLPLFMCAASLFAAEEQDGLTKDVPTSPSFLELSVHNGKVNGMTVIWRVGTGGDAKYISYELRTPFSFEWLAPPSSATAFVAYHSDYKPVEEDYKWIEIKFANVKVTGNATIYHLPFNSNERMINQTMVDRNATNPLLAARHLPLVPKEKIAWCYVGSWNPKKTTWNTIFWTHAEAAATLSTRADFSRPPSSMVTQNLP